MENEIDQQKNLAKGQRENGDPNEYHMNEWHNEATVFSNCKTV
jgi:hypothetical protein